MKKYLIYLMMAAAVVTFGACSPDEDYEPETPGIETPETSDDGENREHYDTLFIGCPVWWWTTPMIICTFAESYDFEGKTVVPFCTYASTYRDETLARIVELTPDADHLTDEELTSGRINEQNISSWLKEIGVIK